MYVHEGALLGRSDCEFRLYVLRPAADLPAYESRRSPWSGAYAQEARERVARFGDFESHREGGLLLVVDVQTHGGLQHGPSAVRRSKITDRTHNFREKPPRCHGRRRWCVQPDASGQQASHVPRVCVADVPPLEDMSEQLAATRQVTPRMPPSVSANTLRCAPAARLQARHGSESFATTSSAFGAFDEALRTAQPAERALRYL